MGRPANTEQGELAKHVVNENGCWIWQGYKNKDGYGETSVSGKPWALHRLSYHFYNGPLENGKMICHTCDTPSCHNPKHLYQGTALDNNRDRAKRNKEGPKKYQAIMAERAGLDAEKVNAIYLSDEYPGILGERYGIHKTTVTRIRKDQSFCVLVTEESRNWRAANPLPNFMAKNDDTRKKLGEAQSAYQEGLDPEVRRAHMTMLSEASQQERKVHNWNRYGRV